EAGTLNLTAPLELQATRPAEQSFLAEVTRMMEAAEQGKSRFVRIADRFARIYAPAVHGLAFITLTGWLVVSGGDVALSLYRAIAVLIITCPCALALAVPIVHVVGAGRLFADGIMVKDGAVFEKLCEIDTVVFDKTGTLTRGKPEVTSVSAIPKTDGPRILALAERSTHPSAHGVAAFLDDTVAASGLQDIREEPGAGIEAQLNGQKLRLGRAAWVAEIASRMPDKAAGDASTVFFSREDAPAIRFELQDGLRPDARDAIAALERTGIDLQILSGDSENAVRKVAAQLGIDACAAEVSPKDKIDKVDGLQATGRRVLMVGDGINDAPALAAAHVSMAPSSGSDVGRQAADLVFTHESLAAVPLVLTTAQRINRLVRQNFALALLYNCLAVPLAVLGFVTPLVAAIAMSSSSILVVANSMRLHLGSTGGKRERVAGPVRPNGLFGARGSGSPKETPA
ncbi:MAG: heavy metal translocating P-type ATPase, partial [Hyphomicrobiaceae bacterium]